ncbi:N-acetylglucosamine kinase-like BadF-type ATPase [Ureibacillus xyleni]|uniref:N-acetylglucosamine kinase-like BadF-type ATPase n=1 Tax=Ureibacillus xyleni TaxID=614648 RepID=A0A285TL97_9BACL|nr:BadF/BadG/BcrA/BcrD ATPase family protein [Ureibacillus xyleni]SOC23118.1 N-acetylglucosamine kinase-like BadF-type ATPase [Ureibacillus xyleni]
MTNQILLAIDGGATKTTISVRSNSGKCIFEKTATGSNYQAIGIDPVEKLIAQLLKDVYDSTKLNNINVAVFAMAGIDTDQDLTIVKEMITKVVQYSPLFIDTIIVENDVHATLLGLLDKNKSGALIISGTGSIGFAIDYNGNVYRTGGWGHRIGDEGSGYWIGKEIVNLLFRLEDGRNLTPTILKELVFEQLNIENSDQLMTWLYAPHYTNSMLASISSVLPRAVELNDEMALSISQHAAQELADLAVTTLKKLPTIDEPFTLFLNGSIFKYHPFILSQFQKLTKEHFPTICFQLCDEPPIEYIVRRAKNRGLPL